MADDPANEPSNDELRRSFAEALKGALSTTKADAARESFDLWIGGLSLALIVGLWWAFTWYVGLGGGLLAGALVLTLLEPDVVEKEKETVRLLFEAVDPVKHADPPRTLAALTTWIREDNLPMALRTEGRRTLDEVRATNTDLTFAADRILGEKNVRRQIAVEEPVEAPAPEPQEPQPQEPQPQEPPAAPATEEPARPARPPKERKPAPPGPDGTPIPLGRIPGVAAVDFPVYRPRYSLTLSLEADGLRVRNSATSMGLLSDTKVNDSLLVPWDCIASVSRSDELIQGFVAAIFKPLAGGEYRGYRIRLHAFVGVFTESSYMPTSGFQINLDAPAVKQGQFQVLDWLCRQPWPEAPTCPSCGKAGLTCGYDQGVLASVTGDRLTSTAECGSCGKKFHLSTKSGRFVPDQGS